MASIYRRSYWATVNGQRVKHRPGRTTSSTGTPMAKPSGSRDTSTRRRPEHWPSSWKPKRPMGRTHSASTARSL